MDKRIKYPVDSALTGRSYRLIGAGTEYGPGLETRDSKGRTEQFAPTTDAGGAVRIMTRSPGTTGRSIWRVAAVAGEPLCDEILRLLAEAQRIAASTTVTIELEVVGSSERAALAYIETCCEQFTTLNPATPLRVRR